MTIQSCLWFVLNISTPTIKDWCFQIRQGLVLATSMHYDSRIGASTFSSACIMIQLDLL